MVEMTTLGELAANITVGHVGPLADSYVPDGVPLLRSQNVLPGRLDFSDVKFITPEQHNAMSKSRLVGGDVVVVRTGRPGSAAVIPQDFDKLNCSDIVIIRPGPNLDPHWTAYYLNGSSQDFVRAHTVGAVQQHFNVRSAKALPIPSLPLTRQIEQVSVLRALDDKIEANNKLASTADALASALYLDATRDKYNSVPLSSLARFVNGKAFTKNATGSGRVVIRIAEMNNGVGPSTVWNELEVAEDNTAHTGDILFAWSGSLTVMRWNLPEAIINQHIFKVIPAEETPAWLVYQALQLTLAQFKAIAADKATTMGHIQRRHLDEPVRIPTPEAVLELNKQMQPLWEQSFELTQENQKLAELRDYLLPRLMSGTITVRNAESLL